MWTSCLTQSAPRPPIARGALLKPGGILVTVSGMADAEIAAARGVRTSGVHGPEVIRPILEELAHLVEAGALVPQVGPTFPLEDAVRAHVASETRPRARSDRAAGLALIAPPSVPA